MNDRAAVCDRPVFVVGAVRSGTTMFRLMLDSHRQICNFGEFEYVVRYANGDEFPDVAKYIQQIEADPAFRVNRFKIEPGLSYLDLAHSFLRQAAERTDKPVITANIHSRMDLLPRLWPNARYIHLGRDPRDVSRSCIGMGWVGNVWHGADVWITAENRWQRLADTIATNDYLEVQFEKLVADPKRELGRICEFLQLDYSDEMLSYPNHSTYSAPDASLANQWKAKLTKREIQLVENKCSALMQSRGYALQFDHSPVPFYERMILYFHNRLKRWQFNINRYGFALYIQWQLAKRLGVARSSWTREVIRRVEAIDEACLK